MPPQTTAPANAMAVWRARELGVTNFSVLVSHVTVPPAMIALLEAPDNRVQGFLAAGHVCTVMGYTEYFPIAEKYRVPIVVTGFEPVDILHGVTMGEPGVSRLVSVKVSDAAKSGKTVTGQPKTGEAAVA